MPKMHENSASGNPDRNIEGRKMFATFILLLYSGLIIGNLALLLKVPWQQSLKPIVLD